MCVRGPNAISCAYKGVWSKLNIVPHHPKQSLCRCNIEMSLLSKSCFEMKMVFRFYLLQQRRVISLYVWLLFVCLQQISSISKVWCYLIFMLILKQKEAYGIQQQRFSVCCFCRWIAVCQFDVSVRIHSESILKVANRLSVIGRQPRKKRNAKLINIHVKIRTWNGFIIH